MHSYMCMITELPVQSLIPAVICDPPVLTLCAPVIRRWRRVSLIPGLSCDPRVSDPWSTADVWSRFWPLWTSDRFPCHWVWWRDQKPQQIFNVVQIYPSSISLFNRHAFTNPYALSHSITNCQAPQRTKSHHKSIITVVHMSCVSYSSHMVLWTDWNLICQSSSLVICRSHSDSDS